MVLEQLRISYACRSLVWTFAVVDLKLRYKNSVLGFFWSFLEPLLLLTVLYSVFTFIFPSQILHYPLYLLLGIIFWTSFSRGTQIGMNCLLVRGGLISTIYFPRFILPLSGNITSFIMMGFELGVFGIFLAVFQVIPSITVIFFPILLVFLFLLSLGISLFLAPLFLKYRDISYIWQILLYAGFFVTPIIYSPEIFPDEIKNLVLLNPVAQIIEMAHNTVLYDQLPAFQDVVYTSVVCVGIFFLGLAYFKRKEKDLVDDL